MVVRPNTRKEQGRRDPTFYLGNKEITKNKLLHVPRSVIFSVVLGIVAYYAPLLGSNISKTNGTQQLVNKGLFWISGSKNKNSFVSLYILSKELNIPPLSAKCTLTYNRNIFNSDSRNVNSENSGNISGNNSSEIGLNNSSNEISNNSDSVNENLSVNNLNQIENVPKYLISFLMEDAIIIEAKLIMPVVSGQRWSVINRYSTKVTKSANADNTVRQASSADDHISAYAHATERNQNSLSGSQTQ
ncbi:hypothetical protein PIROE2DRAFT_1881 [Piromyces sp. E2]|nr:hypothetical protein PIROE2DRAFT_1881 [Piromyces sp. E2]|eukprot:OUM70180.1 hypothetical protein PIROE2DRAFT_1881 [Piromyces sp. E2]